MTPAAFFIRPREWKWKAAVLILLGAVLLCSLFNYRDQFSLNAIAQKEIWLRNYYSHHPVISYSIAFVVYTLVTGTSFPGATVLTLSCGWIFGFFAGVVLVSFASTAGATLAFLASRFFFRDFVIRKWRKSLKKIEELLKKEGPFYLFSLRLFPAVPFFVINLVMGVTPIRTWTFWWVSQLGMLPGTIVFVYAGSNVPNINEFTEKGLAEIMTARLWIAFLLLAAFPYLVRAIHAFLMKQDNRRTPKAQRKNAGE